MSALLSPVRDGKIWRVKIVWPNGAVHHFGKFPSEKDATAIILAIGVADYWFGHDGLFVFFSWMALAAIPWAIGSAIRYILTGRW